MYLIPYIRVSKAITVYKLLSNCYCTYYSISAFTLFPISTISSIIISKFISVYTPFPNLAIISQPYLLHYYIDWYTQKEKKHHNLKLISMIIFSNKLLNCII